MNIYNNFVFHLVKCLYNYIKLKETKIKTRGIPEQKAGMKIETRASVKN